MKSFFLTLIISLSGLIINAQTVLVKQKGVTLSYSSSYVNTLTCGDKKFAQYKVTMFVENNSGHTINIGVTYVSHVTYRNQTDVSPCEHPRESSAEFSQNYWSNNSTSRQSYYVLVPSGDELPEPNWLLGNFNFVN